MNLRKEQIENHLRNRTVVIFNGRVIKRAEEIPSATELAGDDPVHRQMAVKELREAAEKAKAELAELEGQAKELEAPEAPEAPKPAKATTKAKADDIPGEDVKEAK